MVSAPLFSSSSGPSSCCCHLLPEESPGSAGHPLSALGLETPTGSPGHQTQFWVHSLQCQRVKAMVPSARRPMACPAPGPLQFPPPGARLWQAQQGAETPGECPTAEVTRVRGFPSHGVFPASHMMTGIGEGDLAVWGRPTAGLLMQGSHSRPGPRLARGDCRRVDVPFDHLGLFEQSGSESPCFNLSKNQYCTLGQARREGSLAPSRSPPRGPGSLRFSTRQEQKADCLLGGPVPWLPGRRCPAPCGHSPSPL